MISTKELASICGVSLKSITIWASKNGVKKQGRRWSFTPEDCRKLLEYYQIEPSELPLNLINEPFTRNEGELPSNEPIEEPNEPIYEDVSTISELIEANERLIESYKEQVEYLQEQIRTKDEQIANRDAQILELIATNKALSASNVIKEASEKSLLLSDSNQEKKRKSIWKRLFGND